MFLGSPLTVQVVRRTFIGSEISRNGTVPEKVGKQQVLRTAYRYNLVSRPSLLHPGNETTMARSLFCMSLTWLFLSSLAVAEWEPDVLPIELQVGYAVRAVDLSNDGKLDIAIVDSKRIVWLENPTWKAHVIYATPDAKADNVCFAPYDIDGDNDIDFAIGHDWQPNNTESGGKIGWIESPSDPRSPWTYHDLFEEPTTHRMNWSDLDRDGRPELVVAPLKGKQSKAPGFEQTAVRLLAFRLPQFPSKQAWPMDVLDESLHVMHNFQVTDLDGDSTQDLLLASYEGVTSFRLTDSGDTVLKHLGAGQTETAPAKGASEIKVGNLGKDDVYIATIEPWHGDKVVVYRPGKSDWKTSKDLWTRTIVDTELKWGHAVACANVDGDATEELIIGVRDDANANHRCGVRIYDFDTTAKEPKWNRRLVQPGQVAVEDLVVADLDQDGKTDIIAVGRATHNAVIYWNR